MNLRFPPLDDVKGVRSQNSIVGADGIRRSTSDLKMFRQLQRVVHLDAEVPHGALKFAMA